MTAGGEEDDRPVSIWRKILILALIFLLVGPLLFLLLGESISRFLVLYGPVPWELFLILLFGVLGGYYYVRKPRKADKSKD